MSQLEKKLSDFKWENRIIVTFDLPSNEFQDIEDSVLAERKVLYFNFRGSKLSSSNFRGDILHSDFLNLQAKHQAQYLLIGLDGGIKALGVKQDFSLSQLLKKIDSMPMRQSELRKKDYEKD